MIQQFYVEFFIRSAVPEAEIRTEVLEALRPLIAKYCLRFLESEWERYKQGKELGLDMAWPELEYGAMTLTIDPQEKGWMVAFQLDEVMLIEGEEAICEKLMSFAKDFAVSLRVDFGIGAFGWWLGEDDEDEFERLKQKLVLDHIPGGWQEPPPEGSEEFEKEYANYIYGGRPSFYILNAERYEASKPYLPALPVQLIEELANGGVLVFVEYPLRYNIVRRLKKERHWLVRGL